MLQINTLAQWDRGESRLHWPIPAHGTLDAPAICAFLQGFCTVDVIDETQKLRRITFQGKTILEGKFEPAGCFVLRIDKQTHAVCALEWCAAI